MASEDLGRNLMLYRSKTVNIIIGINVFIFALEFLTVAAPDLNLEFFSSLALYHPRSEQFQFYQFITHIFMHGGVWHLAINMFILWMFGNVLEGVWGPKRFLIFYFVTGLGAAGLHLGTTTYRLDILQQEVQQYAEDPNPKDFTQFTEEHITPLLENMPARMARRYQAYDSLTERWQENPDAAGAEDKSISLIRDYYQNVVNTPTVGASGAIYGLLLAFGILFPNMLILLFFFIPIKAKYFVILLGLFELYLGVFGGDTNIANFAHLGGMLFGFILLKIWGVKPGEVERLIKEHGKGRKEDNEAEQI
ncbi:MAG: rhomboid family intramembrane serine protease [Cyclobacteriaceae bacterium]